jgi:hypothetical protein
MKMMEGWEQYAPLGGVQVNEAAVARLVDLLSGRNRMPAHHREYMLREVVTTSDFPMLFGTAIDRQMLARYAMVQSPWRNYLKVGRVPNFNAQERHKVSGQDNILPEVGEKGEYLTTPSSTGKYTIQAKKYGRQFDISFESIINDSMGAFGDIAERFADAAINSENRAATSVYAAAAGPNPLLYGAPITDVDGQAVTNQGVLALTVSNLATTLALMASQTDRNGVPIRVRGVHLVVPPALEIPARAILTSAYVQEIAGAVALPTSNMMPQMGLRLHVDTWLPIVDTSANNDGTWYLFGEPSQGAAGEVAFLAGYERPEVCMKASDKVTIGGGALSPFTGDFISDNIFYRVRHIFATTQLDPRFTYVQVHT